MKTTMNRILTVCLAMAAVTAGAATQRIQRNWEFTTSASPAVSVSGGGGAVVAPGDYASGWIESNPVYGEATGIWDLGRKGTITLTDLKALVGASGPRCEITVRVTQWVDGSIYSDLAEVAVPGTVLVDSDGSLGLLGTIGGWVVDETVWTAEAGVAADTVVLTATPSGTLVDEVSVEVTALVVDPAPALAIGRLAGDGNRVELSWSSAAGDWVLQSSESATGATGWQVVAEPVAVAGEQHTTVIQATDGVRFFRLSKP